MIITDNNLQDLPTISNKCRNITTKTIMQSIAIRSQLSRTYSHLCASFSLPQQYQRVIFYYPLFHKYLNFIKTHLNIYNICPFIRAYIETEDFNNNDNENIDYDLYIEDYEERSGAKDDEDNKSVMSNEGTEMSEADAEASTSATDDNNIYKGTKNPYKNIDKEILRDDILYLDFA